MLFNAEMNIQWELSCWKVLANNCSRRRRWCKQFAAIKRD